MPFAASILDVGFTLPSLPFLLVAGGVISIFVVLVLWLNRPPAGSRGRDLAIVVLLLLALACLAGVAVFHFFVRQSA